MCRPEEVAAKREAAVYAENPVTHEKSNVIVPSSRDFVFPMWIVSMLPIGLSGLILAGVFAAAIFESGFDSCGLESNDVVANLSYRAGRREDRRA